MPFLEFLIIEAFLFCFIWLHWNVKLFEAIRLKMFLHETEFFSKNIYYKKKGNYYQKKTKVEKLKIVWCVWVFVCVLCITLCFFFFQMRIMYSFLFIIDFFLVFTNAYLPHKPILLVWFLIISVWNNLS